MDGRKLKKKRLNDYRLLIIVKIKNRKQDQRKRKMKRWKTRREKKDSQHADGESKKK